MIGDKDKWYLVYCKPRQEERAQQHLANQGFHTFLPRFCMTQNTKPSLKQKELLFPRYLFVQPKSASEGQWASVRSTRGVVDFVRFGGRIAEVPAKVLLAIHQVQLQDTATNELQAGDKVEITAGIYQGVDAIFQTDDGDGRSILLIKLLQQDVEVAVSNREFSAAE